MTQHIMVLTYQRNILIFNNINSITKTTLITFNYQLKMKQETTINFTRINNNSDGNPRYVCHFLNISDNYKSAIKKANKIGGRKFHNKQYGGGIVFCCLQPMEIEKRINELNQNINN